MKINKKVLLFSLLAVLFFILMVLGIVFLALTKVIVFLVLVILAILVGGFGFALFIFYALKAYFKESYVIKDSFNYFIDSLIGENLIGSLIYDTKNKIVWESEFVKRRFGTNIIGQKMNVFFENLNLKLDNSISVYEFNYQNHSYVAKLYLDKKILCIKDITLEKQALQLYNEELSVIGEIEIDSYQLYQSILSEEELYNVNKNVVAVLDMLVEKYNFVYRQYTNGKFLIFTNHLSLEQMSQENFKFFNDLHNVLNKNNGIVLSVSAGFAQGTNDLYEKMQIAKKALLQAQSRGGDQVAIFTYNQPARYYGSTTEIVPTIDRTRSKTLAQIIEKKLNDPAIKNVIVYGHRNADLDALGSAFGIVHLAKAFNKDAYICTSTQDSTAKRVIEDYLNEHEDDIFIKPQQVKRKSGQGTLVFFVDNSGPERTDNINAIENILEENIFIIDHHRLSSSVDFSPTTNRIIDPSASSASELVTEILMFIDKTINITPLCAQMLLNGIYLDTQQFNKHVTSKTFQAASWLEAKGAKSSISTAILKIQPEIFNKVHELLENTIEVREGFYLAYKDIELSDDAISIAADEILRISGRKASFVVAKLEKTNLYKLSARGVEVNVQIIAEAVGGGGHYATAAAVSDESLDVFIDNIRQAIVSAK